MPGGEGAAWRVQWERGGVRVELDPRAEREVQVHTEEAQVDVIGTVFDVVRDPLGTTVDVERGLVRVTCTQSQETITLGIDQRHTCWPITPSGLLARAIHLADSDAPSEAQLATLGAGLALSDPEDPVYGEMISNQITALVAVDRKREALNAARRYLNLDKPPREAAVRDVAVQLAVLLEECDEAKGLAAEASGPFRDNAERALENCR